MSTPGIILVLLLIVLLLGGFSGRFGGPGYGLGPYYGNGGIGLILIIVVILIIARVI